METPSENSVLRELIDIYMKDHYKPLEPEQLKVEAERLKKCLSNQSAGRVCEQSRKEWEEAYENIDRYYKDKREWNKLFQPIIRKKVNPSGT